MVASVIALHVFRSSAPPSLGPSDMFLSVPFIIKVLYIVPILGDC